MADDQDFEMIEFWGEEVPPGGKHYSVEVENEPPIFHMIHVTCCALGEDPKKGPHTLKAVHGGKPIALATLERGACTQFALDFGISSTTTFINTGASPVYISGYITRSVQHFEGSDEEDEDEDDEDDDYEDDDDEPPKLVPIKGAGPGAKKRGSPFVDDEAEETDEGSSEEESEEDEDEEDEGEDEEDEDGMETGSSDEDEDDEGESGDDSDDDGPPEERRNAAPKRPAQPTTPQPAKKAKKEEQRVPASAPPKVQQQQKQQQPAAGKQQQQPKQQGGGGGGDLDAQYLAAMVEYFKQQPAPVPLAALGTRVKRPEGLKTKAKAFVLAHADKLVFDEKAQTVALRKK